MEEKLANWDWESVKIELTQGQAHADELNQQLNNPTSIVSREACGFLLEKVLESYDNALALLSSNSLESPYSDEDYCPKSGRIEKMIFKDVCVSKKRKRGPAKWRDQMRVCSGTESDGYYWRKYGQKKILNAAHPRAYYRCTHRHTQGCLATKQVQRQDDDDDDDDDAENFQVVYIGKHTCLQEILKQNPDPQKIEERSPMSSPNMMVNHRIDETGEDNNFPLFSFHGTPNEPKNLDIKLFSERDGFIWTMNYSSPFVCHETSESYFSTSHCQLNDFSVGFQSSDSDFAEIVSNPTSFVFGDIDTQFLDASDTFW